jgi:hypothetical protein
MSINMTESGTSAPSARDVQGSLPPAKKRKPNWTADECLYLSKLVEEHKGILRAKFGTGVTTAKKREVWKKITDAINAASTTKRTVEEVEKKWHNIQMKGKAELADARRSATRTGRPTCQYDQ